LLKTQLILKGIITEGEWKEISQDINIDFLKDTHFVELKESELLRERMSTLRELDEYVGKYYSIEWVRKNILMQTDDEIEMIDKQINAEKEDGEEGDISIDDL